MLRKYKHTGFSLIELLVSISILTILITIAVPSFQAWLQNSQIRTAAESIKSGLQRARAEAVTRNTNVEFVLGDNFSWEVKLASGASIERRYGSEGSRNVTQTVTPADTTTTTFNSLGGIQPNLDNSVTLTQVELDSQVLDDATSKELRVRIELGGAARMCDPNAPISSPRAC